MEHIPNQESSSAPGTGAGPLVQTCEQYHAGRATTALVLSIIGLVVFFLPGLNVAGLVLAIVGFTMAKKNRKYAADNGVTECGNNNGAYVCGLIGIVVNSLTVLLVLLGIIFFIALSVTAVTAFAPSVNDAISEGVPALEDILSGALPAVESVVRGLL